MFLTELARVIELVSITDRVSLCRDPGDDRFLELALAGRADFLLTGDTDLLALQPLSRNRYLDRRGVPQLIWETSEAWSLDTRADLAAFLR